ncbi:choice-of-anchor Q domain-containing protein [uncultured Polaribacter sp.]|uniref:choice-of-anchor Q domain-containing protein n=1 Tax=uncultured Polaribacter sp. TaxID=174711 RepID=UPI002607C1BD|nr:choice-of-anchor Q domain-containing protein [uncultured Polaribacter sp.]
MKIKLLFALFFITSLIKAQVYVSQTATGSNNGTSWANAYTDLQLALNSANNGDDIWIASGVYSPGNQRSNSFTMNVPNVTLYGGFNGTENIITQRNTNTNQTILDGDVNGDDTGVAYFGVNRTDNNIHVIFVTANNCSIDGLVIRNGHANDTASAAKQEGAGIYIDANNFSINDCVIEKNVVTRLGAVQMIDQSGTLNITNTVFRENFGNSYPVLYTRALAGNTLNVTITNCVINDNKVEGVNSVNNFGLFWFRQDTNGVTNTKIINTTVVNNSNLTSTSTPTLVSGSQSGTGSVKIEVYNSIFYNNKGSNGDIADSVGNGTTMSSATSYQIESSISEDNFSTITHNGTSRINYNNTNTDPLFTNTTDFTLQPNSIAVNNGDNSKVPSDLIIDIKGNNRIQSTRVDIGAFESSYTTSNPPFNVIYVDKNATSGSNDGSTWINAYTNLQTALNNTDSSKQIWVSSGNYKPSLGGGGRFNTFSIDTDYTKLYGGFNGTESRIEERDLSTNITLIDGDVSGDDTGVDYSGVNRTDNSYKLFTINTYNVSIDGFTIANGDTASEGSAIYVNPSNFSTLIDIKLKNIIFENHVLVRGGVVTVIDKLGNVSIENCVFRNNLAHFGTVLYFRAYQSSSNDLFTKIDNCVFENNINRTLSGTGSYGIMWFRQDSSADQDVTISNSTFVENQLNSTSSITEPLIYTAARTKVRVYNSIFWDNVNVDKNTVQSLGGSGSLEVKNSLSSDIFSNISNSSKILSSDPLFTDQSNGNFTLQSNSPAIDYGAYEYVTSTEDISGNSRIQGAAVDLGAYESIDTSPICNISIPDINLKASLIADTTVNTNGDTEISCAEANAFTGGLYVDSENINDATGIQAFENLTILSIGNNSLMNLNLSANKALQELYCYNNSLTSLNLSANTALKRINVSQNIITNLDLSNNIVLGKIDVAYNQLTSLNIANGNNSNMYWYDFDAKNNPNLLCIQVDDVTYSTNNFSQIDAIASFSTNCNSTASIIDNELNSSINVYPNPVVDLLTINLTLGKKLSKVQVFNLLGKKIMEFTNKTLDLKAISSGIYLLKIESSKGEIAVRKIMKK